MTRMPDAVTKMVKEIIDREGGYVDNKHDLGGKTNWGITEAVARQNGYSGDMRNLPRSLAEAIYTNRYFLGPGYNLMALHSERLAFKCMDMGVNMGPFWPSSFMQRLLSSLNRQGRDYADLVADGDWGVNSNIALKAFLKLRGKEGEDVLLVGLSCLQGARYIELSEKRGANEEFTYGWLRGRILGDVAPRR